MVQPQAALKNVYEALQKAEQIIKRFESFEGKDDETIVNEIREFIGDFNFIMSPPKGWGRCDSSLSAGWGPMSDMASAYLNTHSASLDRARKTLAGYAAIYTRQMGKAQMVILENDDQPQA